MSNTGNGATTGASRDPYGDGKQYNPMINGQEVVAVRYDLPDKNGIIQYKLASD